jgi:peptidoglycan/xylan/chitin deacetylase (PgdA/CDA1 family)
MPSTVTIVMYHFVRDLQRSRYPEIKGLSLNAFHGQLEHIKRHYTPITMEELMEAVASHKAQLPPNAILLTFDDGYVDHYTNVFPILDRAGVQGAFFPPAKAVSENQVLDVNKIHFVLASVEEKSQLVDCIFQEITANREMFSLQPPEEYYQKLAVANRYDSAEVIFIKRVLQRELPEAFRGQLINSLFHRFVSHDEAAFASELYMSREQLATMHRHGMHIGSHGYDHVWLNTLSQADQEKEIEKSLAFLEDLGCSRQSWTMCYPYGGYNGALLSILRQKGCSIGFTTHVGIADVQAQDPMILPRLDTNDLPKTAHASPYEWTYRAMEGGEQ